MSDSANPSPPPRAKTPTVESAGNDTAADGSANADHQQQARKWWLVICACRALMIAYAINYFIAIVAILNYGAIALAFRAEWDGIFSEEFWRAVAITCVVLMVFAQILKLLALGSCTHAPLAKASQRFVLACGLYVIGLFLGVISWINLASSGHATLAAFLIPVLVLATLSWRLLWFSGVNIIVATPAEVTPADRSAQQIRGLSTLGLFCALLALAMSAGIVSSNEFPNIEFSLMTAIFFWLAGAASLLADLCVVLVSFLASQWIARKPGVISASEENQTPEAHVLSEADVERIRRDRNW